MAFPTTAVLEQFDRADDASLGDNWVAPAYPGNNSPRIVSNSAGSYLDNPNIFADAYWLPSTFGADTEVFVTVATRGTGDLDLYLRIQDPGVATVDFYDLFIVGSTWQIYEVTNGTGVALGSSASQTISNGDSIGLEAIGTALKAYHKPAAGSWTEKLSTTDSSLDVHGYIAFQVEGEGSPRLDGFGGGTVYVEPPLEVGQMMHKQMSGAEHSYQ